MGHSRVAVVAMGRYGALCVAICAAGGRSRVAVMPMGLCMYVCAARCRRGALTSSCDAYGALWGAVCCHVPLGGAHE